MAAKTTTTSNRDESEISKIIDASDDNPDPTGYVVVIVVVGKLASYKSNPTRKSVVILVIGRLNGAMDAFCGDNVMGFVVHSAVGTAVGLIGDLIMDGMYDLI